MQRGQLEKMTEVGTTLTLSTNQGSLKAKLNEIESAIKELSDSLSANRKSAQLLKGERETLKAVLSLKSTDVREDLVDKLKTLESDMRKYFAQQKAENERIQQHIAGLRNDRNALRNQLTNLQRRIAQVEKEIGSDE